MKYRKAREAKMFLTTVCIDFNKVNRLMINDYHTDVVINVASMAMNQHLGTLGTL